MSACLLEHLHTTRLESKANPPKVYHRYVTPKRVSGRACPACIPSFAINTALASAFLPVTHRPSQYFQSPCQTLHEPRGPFAPKELIAQYTCRAKDKPKCVMSVWRIWGFRWSCRDGEKCRIALKINVVPAREMCPATSLYDRKEDQDVLACAGVTIHASPRLRCHSSLRFGKSWMFMFRACQKVKSPHENATSQKYGKR